jgi:hypothetical protein
MRHSTATARSGWLHLGTFERHAHIGSLADAFEIDAAHARLQPGSVRGLRTASGRAGMALLVFSPVSICATLTRWPPTPRVAGTYQRWLKWHENAKTPNFLCHGMANG